MVRPLGHYVTALSAQRYPLRFVAARLLGKSGMCRFFTIRCGDFHLVFFPTAMSSALWVDTDSRAEDVTFYRAYLRPGDSVIDVGANIGFLSLLAATLVEAHGRVLAFEPHPRTFRYLAENVRRNGFDNVAVMHAALGGAAGTIHFTDSSLDDQNRVASSDSAGIEVPIARLDDAAAHAPDVDLLKLDVEGYELEVLLGAPNVLERTECIYLESWDEHYRQYGTTPGQVIGLLERAGFAVFRRCDDVLSRVTIAHASPVCENLVAARNVDRLAARLAPSGYSIAY